MTAAPDTEVDLEATADDPMAGPLPNFESATARRLTELEATAYKHGSEFDAFEQRIDELGSCNAELVGLYDKHQGVLENLAKSMAPGDRRFMGGERKSELALTLSICGGAFLFLLGNWWLHYRGMEQFIANEYLIATITANGGIYTWKRSDVKRAQAETQTK